MVFLALAENSIQLVPDGTLLLHIGLILLMIFLLNKTLFKPINKVLTERERRTRGGSDEAQVALRRVDERLSVYEKSIRDARAEGYQNIERERSAALGERQAKISSLREDLTEASAREKENIRLQVERSRAELDEEARSIAERISANILGRPIGNA